MRILNPTTPHTPDHNRLTVEATLADIITTGLDLPAGRVQVGYFAAANTAIVTIPVTTSAEVDRTSSKASQALSDAGYGIHTFHNETQGPALHRTDYRAQLSVYVR